MALTVGELEVVLRGDPAPLNRAFTQAQASSRRFGSTVDGVASKAKSSFAGIGLSAKSMAGALAFAGAITSVGALATSFMEFDATMSQVSASTMATGTELDKLRQLALEAGQSTQYSATEAAGAINELSKAGVSNADIMGGALTGALDLAAAGQLAVADAAEIGATALSTFGLEGSQMSHVADLLAAGAGKAQGSVQDMAMALQQSALVAKQTGLSIEETTGALAMFASKGLIGSDAGTSFKTMLMSLNPRSKEAATLMDELGLSAYDSSGQFIGMSEYAGKLQTALSGMSAEQRNATLQTLFGTDAIRAASIMYGQGAGGVQTWIDKVNDSGYAAEVAARLTDNLRGDIERFGGALETAFIEGGSGANSGLREFVQALTDAIPAVSQFVGAIFSVGGTLLGLGATVLSALSPIIGAVGSLIGWLGDLPAPVQMAIAAMVGFAALKGPLTGMFTSFGRGLSDMRSSLRMAVADTQVGHLAVTQFGSASADAGRQVGVFGKSAAVARSGVRSLVTAMGGMSTVMFGLAGLGIGAIFGAIAEGQAKAAQRAAEHAANVDELADAIHNLNPSLAELEDMLLEQSVDSGLAGQLKDLGVEMSTFADAMMGNKDAVESIFQTIENADLDVGDEAVLVQKLSNAIQTLPDGRAKAELLDELGVESEDLGTSAEQGAGGLDDMSSSMDEAGESAQSAADSLQEYLDGIRELRGMSLSVEEAQQGINDAVRDMPTLWEEAQSAADQAGLEMVNGLGQVNTAFEEGSALQDAFVESGDRLLDLYSAVAKEAEANGATQAEAQAVAQQAVDAARESYIQQWDAMGATREEAELLADQYLDFPKSLPMDVSELATANEQVQDVIDQLGELPSNTPVRVDGLTADAVKKLEDLGADVQQLEDGTYVVTMDVDVAADVLAKTQTEIQKVIDKVSQVPVGKSVTIDAITQPAIDGLEEAGYKVEELGNGKYEVTLTAEAQQALEEVNSVQLALGMVPPGVAIPFDISGNAADRLEDMGFEVEKLDNGEYSVSVAADTEPAETDVNEFHTAVDNIPDTHHTEATSNAPAVTSDWGTLDGRIRGTPTRHSIKATSNAPQQSQQFSILTGRIRGTPTSHNTTTTSNAPWQSQNFATLTGRIQGVPTSQSTSTWSNAPTQAGNFSSLAQAIFGVPDSASTSVSSNAPSVEASLAALRRRMIALDGMHSTVTVSEVRIGGSAQAAGGILYNAVGNLASAAPMSGSLATYVPPGTLRVVGDRLDVPELFAPLDGSARTARLIMEAAKHQGLALMPAPTASPPASGGAPGYDPAAGRDRAGTYRAGDTYSFVVQNAPNAPTEKTISDLLDRRAFLYGGRR